MYSSVLVLMVVYFLLRSFVFVNGDGTTVVVAPVSVAVVSARLVLSDMAGNKSVLG